VFTTDKSKLNPTPQTFNFHTQAHVFDPSTSYIFWCLFSCACVGLSLSIRWLKSQSCSLSLREIDYGPVLLGLLVEPLIVFMIGFFLGISIPFIHIYTNGWTMRWIPILWLFLNTFGYGVAGVVVWLAAKHNKMGHVIYTALITIALALLFLFLKVYKHSHISNPYFFFAKDVLIGAMSILGARLGERIESSRQAKS